MNTLGTFNLSVLALDFQPGTDNRIVVECMSEAMKLKLQLLTLIHRKEVKPKTQVIRQDHLLILFYGQLCANMLDQFSPEVELHLFQDARGQLLSADDYLILATDERGRSDDDLKVDYFKCVAFNSSLQPDTLQKSNKGTTFPLIGGNTILILRGSQKEIVQGLSDVGLKVVHLMRHFSRWKGEEELIVDELRARGSL